MKLLPEIRMRDVRVGFSIGSRTVRTHVGTKTEAPVIISIATLISSLQADAEFDLFRCRCENTECDEAPVVRTKIDGAALTWLIDLGDRELRYDLNVAQVASEAERVVSLVQREIDGAHGRDFRIHPSEDAMLFHIPSTSHARGWYLRNNIAYLVSVALVSAGAIACLRLFL